MFLWMKKKFFFHNHLFKKNYGMEFAIQIFVVILHRENKNKWKPTSVKIPRKLLPIAAMRLYV